MCLIPKENNLLVLVVILLIICQWLTLISFLSRLSIKLFASDANDQHYSAPSPDLQLNYLDQIHPLKLLCQLHNRHFELQKLNLEANHKADEADLTFLTRLVAADQSCSIETSQKICFGNRNTTDILIKFYGQQYQKQFISLLIELQHNYIYIDWFKKHQEQLWWL